MTFELRYYHQILYGCSNPHCKTPTCLSCRRRVSKGPFRPYTVLSARTLATFLASDDQPGKGLCPHSVSSLEGSKIQKKKPIGECAVSQSTGKRPQSPELLEKDSISYNRTAETPEAHGNEDVQARDSHHRPQEIDQGSCGEKNTRAVLEEPHKNDQPPKAKDTKSFTQSLFDTISMKLLQSYNICEELARSPGEGVVYGTEQGTRHEDSKTCGAARGDNPATVDQDFVGTGEEVSLEGTSKDSPSPRSITTKARSSPEPLLAVPQGCREAHNRPVNAVATDECEYVPEENLSPRRSLDSPLVQSKKCVSVGKVGAANPYREEQECVPEDSTNGIHGIALSSPPSLSHLSSANIRALLRMLVERHDEPFYEHYLLRDQGRSDFPSLSSTTFPQRSQSYLGFLAFISQSINHVLSSPEALMMSFLDCSLDNRSRMVAQSDALPIMIASFRLLRAIDFHPSNILPSLGVITGHLYPLVPGQKNKTALKVGMRLLDNTRGSLDHLQMCHLFRITFAALIASVPSCSAETIIAVAKLRTSGTIASFEGLKDSSHNPRLIHEILDCAFAFDEEMPLSVLKRVVKAIAARHYGNKCQTDYSRTGINGKSLFAQATYYLLADGYKVYPTDQHAPFLRSANLINPPKPKLARNLEQPVLVTIHWLQALIVKEWDGKPRVPKCSAVGGAIELLRQLCQYTVNL